MATTVTNTESGGDGNPPVNREMDKMLEIGGDDSEEVKAAKLKYRAQIDAQVIQAALINVGVFQGGARSVGVQT